MIADALEAALYLVATPIGNLDDISLRALHILRNADLIACEDTRHTQKLLHHFEIRAATVSYHEHNESARAPELIAGVRSGKRVALVSDAGTPAISDPGYRVVQAAIAAGIRVIPVPGPSAAITALIASGLPTDRYFFGGFLPARAGERRTALESHRLREETLVFYEAPHRILETIADTASICGPDRRLSIARELTKLHEEHLRGTAAELLERLRDRDMRGEITLVIAGNSGVPAAPQTTLASRIRELIASGEPEKAALKIAAREFSIGRSDAYREWQRAKARSR